MAEPPDIKIKEELDKLVGPLRLFETSINDAKNELDSINESLKSINLNESSVEISRITASTSDYLKTQVQRLESQATESLHKPSQQLSALVESLRLSQAQLDGANAQYEKVKSDLEASHQQVAASETSRAQDYTKALSDLQKAIEGTNALKLQAENTITTEKDLLDQIKSTHQNYTLERQQLYARHQTDINKLVAEKHDLSKNLTLAETKLVAATQSLADWEKKVNIFEDLDRYKQSKATEEARIDARKAAEREYSIEKKALEIARTREISALRVELEAKHSSQMDQALAKIRNEGQMQGQIDALQIKNDHLTEQLNDYRSRADRLDREREENIARALGTHMSNFEVKLNTIKYSNGEGWKIQRKESDEVKKTIKDIVYCINTLSMNGKLDQVWHDATKEFNSIRAQLTSAVQRATATLDTIPENTFRFARSEKERTTYSEAMDIVANQMTDLKYYVNELTKQFAEDVKPYVKQQTQDAARIAELEEEISQLQRIKEQFTLLQSQLPQSDLQQRIRALRDETIKLNAEVRSCKEHSQHLTTTAAEDRANANTARDKQFEAQRQLADMQQLLSACKSEREQVVKELKEWKDKTLNTHFDSLDSANKACEKLKSDMDELEKQFELRKAELEEKLKQCEDKHKDRAERDEREQRERAEREREEREREERERQEREREERERAAREAIPTQSPGRRFRDATVQSFRSITGTIRGRRDTGATPGPEAGDTPRRETAVADRRHDDAAAPPSAASSIIREDLTSIDARIRSGARFERSPVAGLFDGPQTSTAKAAADSQRTEKRALSPQVVEAANKRQQVHFDDQTEDEVVMTEPEIDFTQTSTSGPEDPLTAGSHSDTSKGKRVARTDESTEDTQPSSLTVPRLGSPLTVASRPAVLPGGPVEETEDTAEGIANLGEGADDLDDPLNAPPNLRESGPGPDRETTRGNPAFREPANSNDRQLIYQSMKKPDNWDSEVNNDLLSIMDHPTRDWLNTLTEFHAGPACVRRRIDRKPHDQPAPDMDLVDPCSYCNEHGTLCYGLQKRQDTRPIRAAPSSRKARERPTAKAERLLGFSRDTDGYYWDLHYRKPTDRGDGSGEGAAA